MGTLYLIRHGQASFHGDDYDVLSDVGHEQAARLGSYLARAGVRFDALYTGPLRRQVGTADGLVTAARAAGLSLPSLVVEECFSEYPAIELIRDGIPHLVRTDEQLRALIGSEQVDFATLKTKAGFERVFTYLAQGWVDGRISLEGIETFLSFQARVREGLRRVAERTGPKERVALVTSGGPIGIGLQMALGLTDWMAIRTASMVKNASVTELYVRDGELLLSSFNAHPHLDEPKLITLR